MTQQQDKPHGSDCSCRPCEARLGLDQMAERVDAYKSAQSLIKENKLGEGNEPHCADYMILASWLYYGDNDSGD